MRHFLFFLDVILRRREVVHGESEFLGFEAFTRPTDAHASATVPPDKAGPKTGASSGKQFLKAA